MGIFYRMFPIGTLWLRNIPMGKNNVYCTIISVQDCISKLFLGKPFYPAEDYGIIH